MIINGMVVQYQLILLKMDEGILNIKEIPKFEFEIRNDELTNCIKELHFQSKTHEKHINKIKKDLQVRPIETQISDSFILINSNIEIDPALAKTIASRQERQDESALVVASHKLGNKIGQISDILAVIYQKTKQLEKKIDINESNSKVSLNEKINNLQGQLDQFKKNQKKETRDLGDNVQLNINKYQQKLREVESKTLWQINDCKTKLNDRVNEQFVRDIVKQSEARITTKVKQSLIKSNIDPQRIDKLESRCLKLQKDIEIKIVEVNSKINELKDYIDHNLASKKEVSNEKLENQKRFGNLQIQTAENGRKLKNLEIDFNGLKEDFGIEKEKNEESSKELSKVAKMVSNLKISDDFQKLMENLDPHKICEIDTTLASHEQRNLKIERQIQSIKRTHQKFREKVEICNMLNPTDQNPKLDKEEISKIFIDLIAVNPSFKKIQAIEGQLYEFRAYGDMINDINKKIGKIQKQFDLQGVMYSIKGLQEYIKRELMIMNTKLSNFQSSIAEDKRKRTFSAKKTANQQKISSSVSYKKLTTLDCISCFQNPIGDRSPQQRKLFGRNT